MKNRIFPCSLRLVPQILFFAWLPFAQSGFFACIHPAKRQATASSEKEQESSNPSLVLKPELKRSSTKYIHCFADVADMPMAACYQDVATIEYCIKGSDGQCPRADAHAKRCKISEKGVKVYYKDLVSLDEARADCLAGDGDFE